MASEENNKANLILFILDKLIKVSQFIIQAMPHLVRRKIGISINLHPGSTFSLSGSHWLLPCRPCSRHQWGMGFPQTHVNSFLFFAFVRALSCKHDLPYLREHIVCAPLKSPLPLFWHHDIMHSEWNMMSSVIQSELSLNWQLNFLSLFSISSAAFVNKYFVLYIYPTNKQFHLYYLG